MKLSSIIVLALLSLACTGVSPTVRAEGDEKDKEHIRELMRRWDDALVHRNMEFIASILAENFLYTSSAGHVLNKSEYLAMIGDADLRIEAAHSSNYVISVRGDTIFATAEGRTQGSHRAQAFDNHYRYTDTWTRRGGTWKVISTRITDR